MHTFARGLAYEMRASAPAFARGPARGTLARMRKWRWKRRVW